MSVEHDQLAKRQRISRWEPINTRVVEQNCLLSRLQSITNAINNSTLPVDDLCRSPSPPPVYDNRGKRVNTRYDRALDKIEAQRFKLCSRLKKLDPTFIPPRGMRPPKCVDKLYIPKEKEGKQNFIGLILGPRGNTQKRLEKDHECKVAIRGKGSVKDGRARGPPQPEDQEPLHVVITAEGLDAKERIDECKRRILDIITPRQDEDNDHKQAQLRELAQLNGTFREPERDAARPNMPRKSLSGLASNSQDGDASIADDDASHPTADGTEKPSDKELDEVYQSFVKEVTGGSADEDEAPSGGDKHSIPKGVSPSTPAVPQIPGSGPGHGSYGANILAKAPWLKPGAFATRTPDPPPPGAAPPPQPFPHPHPNAYPHPHSHPHPNPHLNPHQHPLPPHAFQPPFGVGGHPPPPHMPPSHGFPPIPAGVPPPAHHPGAVVGPGFVAPYADATPPAIPHQYGIPPLPHHMGPGPGPGPIIDGAHHHLPPPPPPLATGDGENHAMQAPMNMRGQDQMGLHSGMPPSPPPPPPPPPPDSPPETPPPPPS